MTALSGGSISEESFAISTAILAAPNAAFQTDSLDGPGSLGAASVGSRGGEAIDRAMALDEAASALKSLTPVLAVASSCMYLMIGVVGVLGREIFGVDDEDLFRKWGMVDARRTTRPTASDRSVPLR